MVYLMTLYMTNTYETEFFYKVLSAVSLAFWIELLNRCRIFDELSYLIQSITSVVMEMKYFLIVYLIMVFGFSDAFLAISNSQSYRIDNVSEGFIENKWYSPLMYSYLTSLGEFGMDDLDGWGLLMFTLCTILQMIIMLNLLITVIGVGFEKVTEKATMHVFEQRCKLIADYYATVPLTWLWDRDQELGENAMLLIAEEDTQQNVIAEQTD